jgi:O-antigen ligase
MLQVTRKYQHYWKLLKLLCLYGVIVSAIFTWYAVNSIGLISLTACWILEGDFNNKWKLLRKNGFFIVAGLFFLLQIILLYFPAHLPVDYSIIQSKVGFLFIPLVFLSSETILQERVKVMLCCGITLMIAVVFCLVVAMSSYLGNGDPSVFFYHQLVSPIHHHAVYFSAFILSFLYFLINDYDQLKVKKGVLVFTFTLLFLFLLLLSSKSLIISGITVGVFLFFKRETTKKFFNVLLLICVGVLAIAMFLVDNPLKKRFIDIGEGNWQLYNQKEYSRDVYFNGLQFRLLQWRLVYEILNEQHAWWTGLGEKNAQSRLDEQYTKLNMYRGDSTGDRGYLGYNCHNQYLQNLLQGGIPGLFLLLLMIFYLFRYASRQSNYTMLGIVLLLIILFFTESVLERQYGLVLFLVLPLINYSKEERESVLAA